MKIYSLMYHEVIKGKSNFDFQDPGANDYNVHVDLFVEHLNAILKVRQDKPILLDKYINIKETGYEPPFLLTFDDGRESSYRYIADILDEFGWKAHFFIPTDYINSPGFLTVEQIQHIRKRGHIIGTHTCSHSIRLTSLNFNQILNEWSDSIKILSDIIGEPVEVGSVPYGQSNKKVIRAAVLSGIKILFTSTPIVSIKNNIFGNCKILGRFTITNEMYSKTVAGLVCGSLIYRFQQILFWGLKKMPRLFLGPYYLPLRDFYFYLRGNRPKKGL